MISRRTFLRTGAAAPLAAALTSCSTAPELDNTKPSTEAAPPQVAQPQTAPPQTAAISFAPPDVTPPPPEVVALGRMAFGHSPADLEHVRNIGIAAYIEEQLAPDPSNDPAEELLRTTPLRIVYEAQYGRPAVDEQRPLQLLDAPRDALWPLQNWNMEIPYSERYRPLDEVRAATWIRAVHSRWQLREVLVDFWHNHFNINADNDDARLAVLWPIHDREVIRAHALGNFRAFLEAVATSTPMLCALNNGSSRASPANENFARELLELHTLGIESYTRGSAARWSDVPGARDGLAQGYLDDDVYEAARAFTGWSFGSGEDEAPDTGEFLYRAAWHDPYQKRFLAVELDAHAPAMSDGRRVLDILANHPATARHVCTKLCRRLVADNPPQALLDRAVAAWTAHREAPDQIAHTVRAILTAPEFLTTWGSKVRRPFELAVAYIRATGGKVAPSIDLDWMLRERGQRLFGWPAPNGYPDNAGYWMSSAVMLSRWSIVNDLPSAWPAGLAIDWIQTTQGQSAREITAFWIERILGHNAATPTLVAAATKLLTQNGNPDAPPVYEDGEDQRARLQSLAALIAMSPAFQYR